MEVRYQISQEEASEMFGVPEVMLYVCDGRKECGKPYCTDYTADVCHHTRDESHALYPSHSPETFERYPAMRGGEPVFVCVEPVRG